MSNDCASKSEPPRFSANQDIVKGASRGRKNQIYKTVWRLQNSHAKCVALQFPEGLLMFACIIADILKHFARLDHCFILGDVTYGACCVDDYLAGALGCDFLVHYGHSCLVPVDVTKMPCLYVFVTIDIDVDRCVQTIKNNFSAASRLILAGTVQFSPAIHVLAAITVPQSRPLSNGEVLGCTAPTVSEKADALIFVADGRFHLEAMMIANPEIPAYRYDPYTSRLIRERYDHGTMRTQRKSAIEEAKKAHRWGVILGSLGRQGNPRIVEKLKQLLISNGKRVFRFVMSEIVPDRLTKIKGIDAWVQVGCPRLSIDWGTASDASAVGELVVTGNGFQKPVLTPYEAMVAMRQAPNFWEGEGQYPMDYYAKDGGEWSSSHHKPRNKKQASLSGRL